MCLEVKKTEQSTDSHECPGRQKCDYGDTCFAETARDRAASSDVVVVNTALYGQHLVGMASEVECE